jgi:ADP-ribose pyrophosphatase YjhB (NUDIX family)
MRALIQAVYAIRRLLIGRFRIRTRGVKVMLFNAHGELLLIRNTYGNRGLFVLPGGGIGRRESPQTAAEREIREELNMAVRDLAAVATYQSVAEGKRDTIHLLKATVEGNPAADRVEIEEARFFRLDGLPVSVSPATLRRIDELQGRRPLDQRW